VERLTAKLIAYRAHDLGMAMADVEDAEAAQAIDVGAAGNVAIGVRPGIGPLDDRFRARDVRRLAIFKESGIDVVAERLDGFARDPRRIGGRDLRFADQLEGVLCVLINVACTINGNFRSPQGSFGGRGQQCQPFVQLLVTNHQRNEHSNDVTLSG
jgi:hypothetical protein